MDYTPFGLTFNSYQRTASVEQKYLYNGKELDENTGWHDYGARMYMADLGRWNHIDPAGEEYYPTSPYVYALNTPINAIDPDGKRVYFVAGAGNDQIGWNYIDKFQRAFDTGGIQGFTRINASNGTYNDIAFTAMYRSNGYNAGYEAQGVLKLRENPMIDMAAEEIRADLKENPLEDGEQFNLAGYSYGSVLQAHAALKLANEGQYIDNLILIGSPISSDSRLYRQLQKNKNIGKVLRIDIEGDKLSDPSSILEFIQGGQQNADPDNTGEGPHFDLARPGTGEGDQNDTYQRIKSVVVEWLKQQGVE
ncbi:RHS repeat-associated core domain-containing protein [Ekhidna sp.]|uniref:RHS repeat-associated core domain-containing protein n=1 Tax=Ekhidna sp. TaxID=2608089 RepID=UPI003CCBE700